jgi:hypothetical protein
MAKKRTAEKLFAANDNRIDDAIAWAESEFGGISIAISGEIELTADGQESDFSKVPDDWPIDLFQRGACAARSLVLELLFLHNLAAISIDPSNAINEKSLDSILLPGFIRWFNRDMRELMAAYRSEYYRIARKATATRTVRVGEWFGRSSASIVCEIGASLHSKLCGKTYSWTNETYLPVKACASGTFARLQKWADNSSLRDLNELLIVMTDEHDAIIALRQNENVKTPTEPVTSLKPDKNGWYPSGTADPVNYSLGPIEGTEKDVAKRIFPRNSTVKSLRTQLKDGVLWGRKDSRYGVSVWFKEKDRTRYEAAKARQQQDNDATGRDHAR